MRTAAIAVIVVAPSIAAAQTVTFQEGVDGYMGTQDTFVINNFQSDNPRGALDNVNVDGTSPEQHGLLRFDDIFGPGAEHIPSGAIITSATLTLNLFNLTGQNDTGFVHRMLADWDEDTLTWDNALLNGNTDGGIQADGVEARTMASLNFDAGTSGALVLDVTADLQAWADGESNFGWAFFNTVDDSYGFSSSEEPTTSERPLLSVTYVPAPSTALLASLGILASIRRRR